MLKITATSGRWVPCCDISAHKALIQPVCAVYISAYFFLIILGISLAVAETVRFRVCCLAVVACLLCFNIYFA